ncbi:MAG: ABC transporter permease subunit [Acidimicrobiales bacterium]|nr:ABC transporter permease subunit [Acidimicrobiales bacterium]MCB9393868.1 ABC transporter permease subunit [Acidimicrobiaceae bacterium]
MAVATASTATATAPTFGAAASRRWTTPTLVFVALVAIAVAVDPDVPDWLDVGLQTWVRDRYMWTVQNSNTSWLFTGVFNPLSDAIAWCVESVQWVLRGLRYPGVLALTGAIGWMTGGVRAAVSGVLAVLGVAVLGVWDPAMVTLSIMLTAVAIALLIGVPLGIWTARSDRAERVVRTFLDTAQVMPAFVYLIPVTIFFGIRYPPAVVATVVYAVPPAVRLTSLGLRQVPTVMNEVGESFGCTSWQQLVKVQLPMARRTLLLGLNQVIMMAFAIVVIASLLGADDLGNLVLKGLQKNDVGAAFVPGLAIVLLAVALDRITTGERSASSRPPLVRLPSVAWRTGALIGLGTVVVATLVAKVTDHTALPGALTVDISGSINDAVGWVQDNIRKDVPIIGGTESINDVLVADVLEPLREFLVWLPWLLIVVTTAIVAYLSKGWRLAAGCALCLAAIGTMGDIPGGEGGRTQLWDLAMDTLSQVLVAIVVSVAIALPLGIWAGRADRVQRVLRPFLDTAQVMPQFVYLIPVLFLFGAGRGAGVVASVIYAVPPCIRLTSLGLREVPIAPREAAISFGATRRQELVKVQLPLAFRAIMLGINQTILMVLATVIIAALVGAGALGLVAYEGFAKPIQKIGQSAAAGLSIVGLAIVLDRITQAWGTGPDRSRRE